MLPDGIFGHYGGIPGRHNDNFLLEESNLLGLCREHAVREGSGPDSAPEESSVLISPFSRAGERSEVELGWNHAISQVRMGVEHGFGLLCRNWPFVNTGRMRFFQSPVGTYYRFAVLTNNGINCLRPNQVVAVRFE
ncbi:hypothetical protein L218DRAFT_975933 [Marasmius fiardii PR-910]|nr:hypothetical protein L218DRAFT_975933 [Marasmius fiardii PR-910]